MQGLIRPPGHSENGTSQKLLHDRISIVNPQNTHICLLTNGMFLMLLLCAAREVVIKTHKRLYAYENGSSEV